MAAKSDKDKIPKWSLTGELALSCNCDLFCPCVVSLGAAKPTHGYCQAWLAVRIDDGKWGRSKLNGLNVAALLDIPGRMGEGGWTVGLYIDERASDAQAAGIEAIMTGAGRGTTGLFALLVSNYLGAQREAVTYEADGGQRTVTAGKKIMGTMQQIPGQDIETPVTIQNTTYWMGPEVIIAQSVKSKVRDFGRVWNLDQKSAEICNISWSGP